MSGHTAKGTGIGTIYLDSPVAFDTISHSTHVGKLRSDGLLERLKTGWAGRLEGFDGFKLLQLLASNSKSTLGLILGPILLSNFITNLDEETECITLNQRSSWHAERYSLASKEHWEIAGLVWNVEWSYRTAYSNGAMTEKDKLTHTIFKISQKYPLLTKCRSRFIASQEILLIACKSAFVFPKTD